MFCSALLLLLPSDLSPIAELVPPLKRIFILLFFFSVEMSCKEQNETVCRNSGLLLVEQYVIVYNAERIQPNNCKTTSKKKKKRQKPNKTRNPKTMKHTHICQRREPRTKTPRSERGLCLQLLPSCGSRRRAHSPSLPHRRAAFAPGDERRRL